MKSELQIHSMQQLNEKKETKNQINQIKNPQSISTRKAATKLKQKQAQIQNLKRRFKVLKVQQDYNRYRTLDQQKRLKQHQSLHQSIKDQKKSLQKRLNQMRQRELKQLKQRNQKIQQQIKNNTKQTLDSMYSSRISSYNKLKDQSQQNEKLIDQNKKQSLQFNIKRKQQISEEVKRQISLVNQFKDSHIKETFSSRQSQVSKMNQLVNKKQKQLQMLMAYEQDLIKKTSESIAMNQKIKSQFGKVFVDVKQKNSVRFPTINTRGTGSNRSNYSQISKNLSIYEI